MCPYIDSEDKSDIICLVCQKEGESRAYVKSMSHNRDSLRRDQKEEETLSNNERISSIDLFPWVYDMFMKYSFSEMTGK